MGSPLSLLFPLPLPLIQPVTAQLLCLWGRVYGFQNEPHGLCMEDIKKMQSGKRLPGAGGWKLGGEKKKRRMFLTQKRKRAHLGLKGAFALDKLE